MPGVPTSVVARPNDHSFTVHWAAPFGDGGSAITGYQVQYADNGGGSWIPLAVLASTARSATVTGLQNGVGYQVRVAAVNGYGTGGWASPAQVEPHSCLPGIAANLSSCDLSGADLSDANLQYALLSGADLSGANLQRATLQRATLSGTNLSGADLSGANLSNVNVSQDCDWSGDYCVDVVNTSVTASDLTGAKMTGANLAVAYLPNAIRLPGVPTPVAATAGDGSVSLSWSAPFGDGGLAITGYRVEYKALSAGSWSVFAVAASTARAATVTGLVNGTSYVLRVSAVNSQGAGAAAAPASAVTPTP